jgi:hypothetical protein
VTPRSSQPHVWLGTLRPRLTLKLTSPQFVLFATRAFVALQQRRSSTPRLGQQPQHIRQPQPLAVPDPDLPYQDWTGTLLTIDRALTHPTIESRSWPHRAVGKAETEDAAAHEAATRPTQTADAAKTTVAQRRTTTSGRRKAYSDSAEALARAATSAIRECPPSL